MDMYCNANHRRSCIWVIKCHAPAIQRPLCFFVSRQTFQEYEHVGDWLYCKKRSGQVLLHLFDELIKGYSGDIIT